MAEPNFPNFDVFYDDPDSRSSEQELDRQTVEHYAFKLAFKQNFIVPLDEKLAKGGAKCIDVGTGMGIWVMEMSADFPRSDFIGVDKNQTFPTSVYPNNADFLLMDATKPWPYEDKTFDFIQQRMLFMDYTRENWPFVLKEMARCIKPGGWVQFVEPHVISYRASAQDTKLCNWVVDVLDNRGYEALVYKHLPDLLEENGFTNIGENEISIPFGYWGGTIGTLIKEDAVGWTAAFKSQVVQVLNVSEAEYDATLADMLADCETYKTYVSFAVIIAEKAA